MAEGTRSRVDCEPRRSSRRRRKPVLENTTKKECKNDPVHKATEVDSDPLVPECAVCLQPCVYPSRLPCSHIFCFLCLKGIVTQSMKCAMCRQPIPADYLDHPDLVPVSASSASASDAVADKDDATAGYQWFYEGRDGWWQYDVRTNGDLETAFKQGDRSCELLIAGHLYLADFDAMQQVRRDESFRVRRIKRDLATMPKKGVAGLRLGAVAGSAPSDDLANQMANLSLTAESSTDVSRQ
ncbi:E3 ubiquitin-protein ligase rnf146 [Nilaparvata lugens]|uniref:E3 ubiquitin-protein ligase rnf146 n=1 Tax=Nilaparvata lugens TaxID=108931 RepID=UPI00193E9BE7|nr:E3 ubiquitin-protein ligase rnf146 [Nilaparvata lugens]